MDKELPWLADNAQLELKYKKAKRRSVIVAGRANQCPLSLEVSSRHWVMNCYKKAEKKKNIVWRYENFFTGVAVRHHAGHQLDRRTQTLNPGLTMAALACIAQNDSQQLLDEIVQQEGLEYATEVVIARQFIARCYESDPLVVTLQYQDEDYGYGYRSETYNEFDLPTA